MTRGQMLLLVATLAVTMLRAYASAAVADAGRPASERKKAASVSATCDGAMLIALMLALWMGACR